MKTHDAELDNKLFKEIKAGWLAGYRKAIGEVRSGKNPEAMLADLQFSHVGQNMPTTAAEEYAAEANMKRENQAMRLAGSARVPYTLLRREGYGLVYVCTHRLDDLRQGDMVRPHKNLGWFQVAEIWKPDGFVCQGKAGDMTLIAVVEKVDRSDSAEVEDCPEDGECLCDTKPKG